VSGHESECMIVFIFLRQRISIFPMNFHENRLNHNTSMSVIENLLNILSSSNFNQLFSFNKIMPCIIEHILHFSRFISNCFIIHIFVINISSC